MMWQIGRRSFCSLLGAIGKSPRGIASAGRSKMARSGNGAVRLDSDPGWVATTRLVAPRCEPIAHVRQDHAVPASRSDIDKPGTGNSRTELALLLTRLCRTEPWGERNDNRLACFSVDVTVHGPAGKREGVG